MSKPHEPKTLCKSSRTETAPQMPSPERSKIIHSHEPRFDETTRGEKSEGDHLIVNPDFFVNATNNLGRCGERDRSDDNLWIRVSGAEWRG